MNVINSVNDFFAEILDDINCRPDTRAYVIGVFSNYKSSESDFSKSSISLLFADARLKHDFASYQTLADWVLYSNSIIPEHLKFASRNYYDTVAQLSYYSCYKIINKQWLLFEELSDRLPEIEDEVKNKLGKLNI